MNHFFLFVLLAYHDTNACTLANKHTWVCEYIPKYAYASLQYTCASVFADVLAYCSIIGEYCA